MVTGKIEHSTGTMKVLFFKCTPTEGDVCVNVSLESPNSILNSFCSQVEPCCHSIVEPALQSTDGSK